MKKKLIKVIGMEMRLRTYIVLQIVCVSLLLMVGLLFLWLSSKEGLGFLKIFSWLCGIGILGELIESYIVIRKKA